MSPDKIQECNPNLKHETNQTKIAYAKFKVGTIKAEKERRRKLHEQNKIQDVIEETRSSQEESSNASISYENETKRPGSDHDWISSAFEEEEIKSTLMLLPHNILAFIAYTHQRL